MRSKTAKVLLISKPISPPWSDSNKNIAKEIIENSTKYRFRYFTLKGCKYSFENGIPEFIYSNIGKYTPSIFSKLRVFLRLFISDNIPIYHFLFTPNNSTSSLMRLIMSFKKRITVQTIMSKPDDTVSLKKLLFADCHVVLSQYTLRLLKNQGIKNIRHIPPGIPLKGITKNKQKLASKKTFDFDDRPVILFAGDYQFSDGAFTILKAIPEVLERMDVVFVYACRIKQQLSKEIESKIKIEIDKKGLTNNVRFFNELDNIGELVAISSIGIMPVNSLYAKMDIPLVLLECLSEKVPIIVSNIEPLSEILIDKFGVSIPPSDSGALAKAIISFLSDKKSLSAMGEIGRKSVERYFNSVLMTSRYEKLYNELLENSVRK
jgi:glycosyltransferase involved in cell wall biosynthesis